MTRQIFAPPAGPSSPPSVSVVAISSVDGPEATDVRSHRIKQLEDELATLRDDMRSAIEEQEIAHEKLQLANEKVIRSNEELQINREEIDLTNEKLLTANQELRVRNDRLSEANAFAGTIFGTIREAIVVLTPDLRIRNVNPVFHSLFGLEEADVEGQLIYELANRRWDILQLRSLLTNVTTCEVPVRNFELTHSFPGVGEKVLSLNARRVVWQQEVILLAIEDITEHRRLQRLIQEREDLTYQLRQTDEAVDQLSVLREQVRARARGELLHASSHDLRASLGIIQGAADLLSFADSDQERGQMLDVIQRNVKQTTRLITELLDFSRLEAGRQSVSFAPFDAADLLRQLGENVRPLIEKKGLTLHLSGEDSLPVEGDALNVFRIAQNVVLNALNYTDQGSIGMRWGNTGPDEWFFGIDDTGPGMEQDAAYRPSHGIAVDSPDLPFGRSSKFLPGPAGEGIGLTIVRQLCELLRGRSVIDSPSRGVAQRSGCCCPSVTERITPPYGLPQAGSADAVHQWSATSPVPAAPARTRVARLPNAGPYPLIRSLGADHCSRQKRRVRGGSPGGSAGSANRKDQTTPRQ